MKARRILFILSIAILIAPQLSGNDPAPVPELELAPAIPPAEYTLVSDFLKSRRTALDAAQIHTLTRTVLTESEKAGFNPQLVVALIHVESSGNSRAVSRVGALGLMQVVPETGIAVASELGIEWRGPETLFDPVTNVRIGVHYLAQLVDRFGDLDTALAAYNWGPTRIARVLRRGRSVPNRYIESVHRATGAII